MEAEISLNVKGVHFASINQCKRSRNTNVLWTPGMCGGGGVGEGGGGGGKREGAGGH